MSATLTITGKVGPGNTVTAGVFAGVSVFTVDTDQNMIYFVQNGVNKEISINAATTVTATKSANVWTLTIS